MKEVYNYILQIKFKILIYFLNKLFENEEENE